MPINMNMTVSEARGREGDWNWEWLNRVLPMDVVEKIRALPPPCEIDGEDRIIWKGGKEGEYTVAEMYRRKRGEGGSNENQSWAKIWKLNVTRRIQVFLWIASHDRLLTALRKNKLLGGDPTCSRCRSTVEDTMHVLRDCPIAQEVWRVLRATEANTNFFSRQGKEWISDNLEKGSQWSTIFSVSCWWLWKWRNLSLFDQEFQMPTNPEVIITKYAWECSTLIGKYDAQGMTKTKKYIRWVYPQAGWVKLNFDGAAKGWPGRAGCGGS